MNGTSAILVERGRGYLDVIAATATVLKYVALLLDLRLGRLGRWELVTAAQEEFVG